MTVPDRARPREPDGRPDAATPGNTADDQTNGPSGDPAEVARLILLRMLERRAYSRAELADVLRKRGVPVAAADRVLDRFVAVGLVDDGALADGYALAQHRGHALARRAIAVKLRQRGIDADTVQAAVAQIDRDSETAAARTLVERRLRSLAGLEPAVQARRLVGLLARKGYPAGLAHEVVRSALRSATPGADADGDTLAGVDALDEAEFGAAEHPEAPEH